MNKPNEYDNTREQGEYTPVQLGGHYMVIKAVEEMKSSKGQDMIKVSFDFDKNDVQPDYFMEAFKNDIRPDKKWPNQGTQYILVHDQEGKTNRSFKTFCTCAEHSNGNFVINWGDNWGAQFKGKKIGGVFGIQHDFYDGKELTKHVLRWFVSLDKVDGATIPQESSTKAFKDYQASHMNDGQFAPAGNDEEIPWFA